MKTKAYAVLKDNKISVKDIYDKKDVKGLKIGKNEKLVEVTIITNDIRKKTM